MIIDKIIDRIDDEELFGYDRYNAHDFYFGILAYGEIGKGITYAMDYGTNEDIQNALCDYIDTNDYNPELKQYINAKEWL